jgi:hypothetical protein
MCLCLSNRCERTHQLVLVFHGFSVLTGLSTNKNDAYAMAARCCKRWRQGLRNEVPAAANIRPNSRWPARRVFCAICESYLTGSVPCMSSVPCLRQGFTIFVPRSVRVRVTLQLTVSQSVSLGVEPNLGLLTRDFFFFFERYGLVLFGAPSLTRGRVCHLSVYSQSTVVSQYLHKIFTFCVIHIWH